MAWLILSDLHANLEALQAALEAAAGRYDRVACLGDLVGYGPDPGAVVDWVEANVEVSIRGNHDKVACGLSEAEEFNYAARAAALWTRQQLSEDHRAFLWALPAGPAEVEGFFLVHGAPSDEDRYIATRADALEEMRGLSPGVVFFGHTHQQGGYVEDGDGNFEELRPTFFRGRSAVLLEVRAKEKYLLNPGSVGQPRDGDPRAAFALYDPARGLVEFWRVAYAVENTQYRMEQLGLPDPLVQRLSFGR